MNDLREAAKMALECLDYHWDNPDGDLEDTPYVLEAKKALRQALARQALDDLAAESQRLGLYEATPEWDAVDRFYVAKLKENT
jgi:hypothetical protein